LLLLEVSPIWIRDRRWP